MSLWPLEARISLQISRTDVVASSLLADGDQEARLDHHPQVPSGRVAGRIVMQPVGGVANSQANGGVVERKQ
jgi:hypothetical protein